MLIFLCNRLIHEEPLTSNCFRNEGRLDFLSTRMTHDIVYITNSQGF